MNSKCRDSTRGPTEEHVSIITTAYTHKTTSRTFGNILPLLKHVFSTALSVIACGTVATVVSVQPTK